MTMTDRESEARVTVRQADREAAMVALCAVPSAWDDEPIVARLDRREIDDLADMIARHAAAARREAIEEAASKAENEARMVYLTNAEEAAGQWLDGLRFAGERIATVIRALATEDPTDAHAIDREGDGA